MATTSNLSSIIRFYAEKQNSPFIDLKDFYTYIKKYAEHHVEENGELVKYLGDPSNTVNAELEGLTEKHLACIVNVNNKKTIFSAGFISEKYAKQFHDIEANDGVPYPIISDLKKNIPVNFFEHKAAELYIPQMISAETLPGGTLFILDFAREMPAMLLPGNIPISTLVQTAQAKIRKILKKEEFHDYFLKKLRGTNPTKEITIRSFFDHFVDKNENNFVDFKQDDDYYLWNQLLYFIRQDFEKIQDRTIEDTNILQAIIISEIYSTFLKEKFQKQQQKEEAFKSLEANMSTPPYFYSMNQIVKFKDEHGNVLLTRYSEEELKEYFEHMTTGGDAHVLPDLLIFKVSSGTRYYVYKKKILSVIVRLCNEAHESIEKTLEEKWLKNLLEYEKLPEMSDNKVFEKLLQNMVELNSPVLHSILNANFLPLLALESSDNTESVQLFADNKLLPYTELLMLKNSQIYANARARLPLTYTIPLISWLISLFKNKKSQKTKEKAKQAEIEKQKEEDEKKKSELLDDKPKNKQAVLANKATAIAQELIPEGSTIDRELDYLNKQWNRMITPEANRQLTEDVNALIRDYTRRVVKSLSSQSFSKERLENLANTLVRTPNMQKIKDTQALTEYVTLYMLRLVSNFK